MSLNRINTAGQINQYIGNRLSVNHQLPAGLANQSTAAPVDVGDVGVVFEQRGSLDAAAASHFLHCILLLLLLFPLLLLWCLVCCFRGRSLNKRFIFLLFDTNK